VTTPARGVRVAIGTRDEQNGTDEPLIHTHHLVRERPSQDRRLGLAGVQRETVDGE
jgi:hypothetical protein